ncbi:hypothetical protein [Rhizobium leguminosarum]|uniref:hypothetical protein n=1 Tax=Rhizobium leguminosarum TaxID=384 RepID=UPI00102FC842|nr:hypothetical protein [Rhizobium leguminosarum]TAY90229.1 hypothetical protein ELH83_21630 [Rhizobium leguminosarum]
MVDAAYIEGFKTDLLSLSSHEIYAKYIEIDQCRGFETLNDGTLRQIVADHFGISLAEVIIVGSAKLGFTLRPKRARDSDEEDRPRFSPFSDRSDVDVAIVSPTVFDAVWEQTFTFWHSSGYLQGNYWPKGGDFRQYIFRGWMRPDMLPSEGTFTYKNHWFDFFRSLTNLRAAGDFKISAGLYRNMHFLEHYQHIAIDDCRRSGALA